MPAAYLDLWQLQALANGIPDSDHTLSAETKYLCLTLLDRNRERWQWRSSGGRVDDSQWDEIEAIIATATDELT